MYEYRILIIIIASENKKEVKEVIFKKLFSLESINSYYIIVYN